MSVVRSTLILCPPALDFMPEVFAADLYRAKAVGRLIDASTRCTTGGDCVRLRIASGALTAQAEAALAAAEGSDRVVLADVDCDRAALSALERACSALGVPYETASAHDARAAGLLESSINVEAAMACGVAVCESRAPAGVKGIVLKEESPRVFRVTSSGAASGIPIETTRIERVSIAAEIRESSTTLYYYQWPAASRGDAIEGLRRLLDRTGSSAIRLERRHENDEPCAPRCFGSAAEIDELIALVEVLAPERADDIYRLARAVLRGAHPPADLFEDRGIAERNVDYLQNIL